MAVLYFLADLFINVFGITQPTEKKRRQAGFFILGLACVVVGIATAAFLIGRASMR